jgi:hypothetical protein
MDIYLPDAQTFDFKALTLADPVPVPGQNGFYTTKLSLKGKPVYMQLPQGVTKDAFVATKLGKYCDLMYERQQRGDLVAFFEQVEFTCQDLIDAQKNKWFQNDLTHDDIENMMSSVTRLYQSGKYVLIRSHVIVNGNGGTSSSGSSMKFVAYNEKEIGVDLDAVLPNRPVIPLLLLDGVKFSSKSFDIDLKLVQLMVLDDTTVSACLIKRTGLRPGAESTPVVNEPLARAAAADVVKPVVVPPTAATASSLAPEPAGISFIITEPLGSPQPVTNELLAPPPELPFTESAAVVAELEPPKPPLTAETAVVEEPQTPTIVQEPQEQVQAAAAAAAVVFDEQQPQPQQPIEIVLDQFQAVPPLEAMTLKKPNEVYYDIYRAARRKARGLRKDAIEAYLEAKEIKTKYMLTDLDEASSSDDEDEDDEDEDEDDEDKQDGEEEDSDDDDDNDKGEESDDGPEDDQPPPPPPKGGKAA